MSKPTFVFAHGAWHSGSCWTRVAQTLETHGYQCVALDLPGVRRYSADAPVDARKDAETIREAIMTQLDNGKDVIVACHSWGGLPTAGAVRDLDPAAKKAAGFTNSVVGLAAITSFIILEGQSFATAKGPFADEESLGRAEGLWAVCKDPGPIHYFYHDLPADEAEKWAATLHPHAIASIADTCKYSPYGKIPTHYLICTEDRAISKGLQRHLVQQIREQGWAVRTEEINASHSPFLSQVEKTANYLRRCAGEQIPED